MHDRTPMLTAFTDLEDSLFGWNADVTSARTQGFVQEALRRRRRVRTRTDRYPAVPLGPDTSGLYAGGRGETTYISPFAARNSGAS